MYAMLHFSGYSYRYAQHFKLHVVKHQYVAYFITSVNTKVNCNRYLISTVSVHCVLNIKKHN